MKEKTQKKRTRKHAGIKVETKQDVKGNVGMEIKFNFPGRSCTVKAKSLAEAQRKVAAINQK